MRKLIARIAAFVVCIVAVVLIYYGVKDAYLDKSVADFITVGQNFAESKQVEPSEVNDNTSNGEFVKAIAIYLRTFQDINHELDSETNKILAFFDQKNLQSVELIEANLARVEDYKALVVRNNTKVEDSASNLVRFVERIDKDELKIGNAAGLKQEMEADKEFRKTIGDLRNTIASYMEASIHFLYSRYGQFTFAENGGITFAKPEDQKYFYDLMTVVKQMDEMLKNKLAENREELRANVSEIKNAYHAK